MLSAQEKATIYSLLEAGISVGEIAKRIRRSVSTIQNYRKLYVTEQEASPSVPESPGIPKKLLPFTPQIDKFIRKGLTNSVKIYQLAKDAGYEGSYGLLNFYVREVVSKQRKGLVKHKQSTHLEVVPGEEAQVDWGSFGTIREGGRLEKLSAFVYVLSYSRAIYVEFVVRQNEQTFQACHMHAFEKLGMPRTILYDNAKTVVLGRDKMPDGSVKINWHPAFLDFATYYGFQPRLCHPYWPRSKGKVEAGVKYLRNNFMAEEQLAKSLGSLEELNLRAAEWVEKTAQQRIHRATDERPIDRWEREKVLLQFHSSLPPYSYSPFLEKRSTKDGIVHYKRNLYQVSPEFAQKKLYVREVSQHGVPFLEIFHRENLICTYQISAGRGEWISNEARPSETTFTAHIKKESRKVSKDRPYLNLTVPVRAPTYYDVHMHKRAKDE